MPGLYVGFDPAALFFAVFLAGGVWYLITRSRRDS